jgi:membrane associated rhomboid family serine protease
LPMFLPIRAKNPPESLPIATCILIFANVGFYALTSNGIVIHRDALVKFAVSGLNFDLQHILTAMFLHGSIFHILGNMWFLYLFGFAVEGRMRSLKFLVIYFVAGFAGTFLDHFMSGRNSEIPSLGASGAIMGIVAAGLWLFPHAKISTLWSFFFRFGVTDWPLWVVALYYLGLDVFFAILGAGDGVAHLAHIGGAVGGLLACMAFLPRRDTAEASEAKATLAETKDLSTLSRMELSELHRANPTDDLVVLHWMTQSLREPGGPRDDCTKAFEAALPGLVVDYDIRTIAPTVRHLHSNGHLFAPRVLADIATRLERAGEHSGAVSFFEMVAQHPKATPADLESAIFRVRMLCESALNDPGRAWQCYQQIVSHWPMGPFADQARARQKVLASRTNS